MKSPFLNLELMHPNQIGKEVLFNETILKIEQLCSQMIIKFTDHTHQGLEDGLYIISKEGDKYHNHLSYRINNIWKYIHPQINMIFFVKENNQFYSFNGESWEETTLTGNSDTTQTELKGPSSRFEYIGVSGEYTVPDDNDFIYLYIQDDSNIKILDHSSQKITLLIKQHHRNKTNITWGGNIIFAGESLDLEVNNIAILDLYKTPEDNRYLVNIIGIYK